jgi:hypothetical protein
VNDAPLVSPAALTIAENAPATTITASLLANASDPDPGQTASLVVSSVIPGPTTSGGLTLHGTVVRYLTDGRFDSLQEGQTAEDVFDFEVRDPLGAVALAKATVIITGVNTAPVALAATPLLALPDASIDLTAVLAASVIDPDDAPDDIRIHAIDPTGVQGTLVLDNGRLSYTPPAGLVVPDGRYFEETFRYRARDLRGATSDEATATLVFYRVIPQAAALPKLVVEAVPGTPIPFLDTFDFGGALLTEQKSQTFIVRNDGDAPLDIIAVQTVYGNEADFPIEEFTMPALLAPGESRQVVIHFAPKALGNRQSEFWITSNDPDHEHFKILLTGTGNRAPLFYGYEAATAYETPASILRAKILQAGWDPDGHALTVGAVAPATREGGSAEIIGNYVRYTPPAGFWGEDIITVTIRDAFGATASGPLTVTVRPPANAGGPNVVAPSLTPVPGGGMRIRARAIPGFTYEIQRSTNLTDWETIATVPAGPTGGLEHTDPNPPQPSGFYRIHGR